MRLWEEIEHLAGDGPLLHLLALDTRIELVAKQMEGLPLGPQHLQASQELSTLCGEWQAALTSAGQPVARRLLALVSWNQDPWQDEGGEG